MAGDGSERRCALCAKNNEIGQLSAALIEQFLSGIAGNNDGLHGDFVMQFRRNQAKELSFDLVD
jgi:hypothetical protein